MSETTIQTYKTSKYSHSGVTGSEVVTGLNDNYGTPITPQVLTENNITVSEKIVKDNVKEVPTGTGVSVDAVTIRTSM